MVARFLYRVVSVLFMLVACIWWALAAAGLIAQIGASEFNVQAFAVSILSVVFAFMAHQASIEAWRAARTYYRDPLWSNYP